MKRRKILIILLIIIILLSACNTSELPIPTGVLTISIPPTPSVVTTGQPEKTPLPSISPISTPSPTPKQNPTVSDLHEYLGIYLATYPGDYGMYYYNLDTKEGFGIRDKEKYIAASTSKVPINMYLYKLVEENKISLDTEVEYLEEDQEWGTGKIIKEEFGVKHTLRELSKLSIEVSDNCAINMIIRTIGKENFISYMNSLGAVIDYHTYRTCPYDLYLYFDKLYESYINNPSVYGEMMGYLKNTIYNDRIPKLLPTDVEIAHKIGNYDPIPSYNDGGIIFANNDYILTLMSNEVHMGQAYEIIQNTSKIVYDFITYGTLPAYTVDNTMFIPDKVIESARPYTFDFYNEVLTDSEVTKYYFDNDNINFGSSEKYAENLGITTFRGNNYRDGGSYGSLEIKEEKLEIIWEFDIGIIISQSGGYWPGVGWTGQPSIVNWDQKLYMQHLMEIYIFVNLKQENGQENLLIWAIQLKVVYQ